MCIRDSSLYFRTKAGFYSVDVLAKDDNDKHLAEFLGSIIVNMNRIAENKGCLLYTSDAADERSSVDLGGRRIIKKKQIKRKRTKKRKKKKKKNNDK